MGWESSEMPVSLLFFFKIFSPLSGAHKNYLQCEKVSLYVKTPLHGFNKAFVPGSCLVTTSDSGRKTENFTV